VHILHICACFPPTWAYGGIPRAVEGLVRAQVQAGARVRVWTTDALDATSRAMVPLQRDYHGVEVITTKLLSNRLAWEHQLYLPTSTPPLKGIELVHLHGHRHLLNWLGFKAAKAAKLPIVITAHGTVPRIERKIAVKWLWDRIFDGNVPFLANKVIAVSKAEVRDLLGLGVLPERVVRIPNGLELPDTLPEAGSFRRRYGIEGRLVAYLGQITPRKQVTTLLRVFEQKKVAATLVVAGPVRGMQLPEVSGVRVVGVLKGEERLALLQDADVLAYPGIKEVFGLVPLEGLWCGAPVVVGEDCGCGELVAEAKAGLTVPGGDVEALSGALNRLLKDRQEAAAMVARGRAFIEQNFTFSRIAKQHLELYASVLA
jgi:glycosyltransferase involved in cell wall biosynthesis